MRTQLLVLFISGSVLAAEATTGPELIDNLDLTAAERQQLESGQVVAFSDEAYESTPRELAADASVIVSRSLDDVLAQIESVPSIIPSKLLLDFGDIESVEDLGKIAFTADEFDEAEKLLGTRRGKSYNLSEEELATLSGINRATRNKSRSEKLEAASAAIRDILKARYTSYMAEGLDGVPGYQRSRRKTINIGDELRLTTETLEPVERHFNDYYSALMNFPADADCCEHKFRWIKAVIRKRPTFALSHTITRKTNDYLLITERHYYVSNTLNSVQVTLAWVEWEEDTFMGLAMSASTDILDSMMGRMLRPLGRNKASDMVTEIMTEIRDELEQGD